MTSEPRSLSDEYKRQFAWRSWPTIFEALPSLQGKTVLDLGCGVGDLAAQLAARGARVIGIDMNEEFICVARSLHLSNAEFRLGDLRAFEDPEVAANGIWCSFTAAYFPDLSLALGAWARSVKPGGWIALTEIDDLFGHEPLSVRTRELLRAYAEDSLAAGRYDFFMGRKLRDHLERCEFAVSNVLTVEDQEFSFSGPARPEVVEAWRNRLNRMKILRDFCGPHIDQVQEEFLSCLTSADHRSAARVICCIANKGARG